MRRPWALQSGVNQLGEEREHADVGAAQNMHSSHPLWCPSGIYRPMPRPHGPASARRVASCHFEGIRSPRASKSAKIHRPSYFWRLERLSLVRCAFPKKRAHAAPTFWPSCRVELINKSWLVILATEGVAPLALHLRPTQSKWSCSVGAAQSAQNGSWLVARPRSRRDAF